MIRVVKPEFHRNIKRGGTLPEMTFESGNAYRSRLIAQGLVSPSSETYGPWDRPASASTANSPRQLLSPLQAFSSSPGLHVFWDRPCLSSDSVKRLRARLIASGNLTPKKKAA